MRILIILLLFTSSIKAQFDQQMHCGFDFTSYLVLHIHEEGNQKNIPNLKVTIIDKDGKELINTNNKYSWVNSNKILRFYENYKIDSKGNKVENSLEDDNLKWHFPFANATYLLSITNEFPADDFLLKIEDMSENPIYKTTIQQLYSYNMYVLCTSQVEQKSRQFGRRINKPLSIVLEKK